MDEDDEPLAATIASRLRGAGLDVELDVRRRGVKANLRHADREGIPYVVIVGDYDLTNEGKDYRHNDFHIIPRGVIRKLTYLTDSDSLVSLQIESESA